MSDHSDVLDSLDPKLLKITEELSTLFYKNGGNLLLVGGSVRDLLIGISPLELDFEARGINLQEIKKLLSDKFKCDEVGKAFGVLRIKEFPIEIALPRTEKKAGTGHKGFDVEIDHHLPFERAVQRRDFTINAMALDPLERILLDPCNGEEDLKNRILRHVGPAFCEDPLRVLRGMQFIARFDLSPNQETIDICKSIDMENLASERIFEEWKKLILKGKNITGGLNFLKDTGWVKYFP